MFSKKYKISVTVPIAQAAALREAMTKAGAGLSDKYSHATFSVQGIGRFKPLPGAHPAIGQINKLEEALEEKIETVCSQKNLKKTIEAIKQTHPYEEPVIDVWPLENL